MSESLSLIYSLPLHLKVSPLPYFSTQAYKYRASVVMISDMMLYQPKWVQSSYEAGSYTPTRTYTLGETHKCPHASMSARKPISCRMAPLTITTASASYLYGLIYSGGQTFLCSTGDFANKLVVHPKQTSPSRS